jgi:hypothetical protein
MNTIHYKNILNGNFVIENEEIYSHRLLKSIFFEEKFIDVLNLNIVDQIVYSGCTIYKLISKNNKSITALYQPIKNSGSEGNNSKRFQVPNSLSDFSDENFWFIGSYNCGDKVLFVITRDPYFLTKERDVSSYSSLWVDFEKLEEAYTHGICVYSNRNGRKYYIVDSAKISDPTFQGYFNNAMLQETKFDSSSKTLDSKEDYSYELYDESKHSKLTNESLAVVRNSDFRTQVLEQAGYKCELCGSEETFLDASGKMYFEGHHIIPYNIKSQNNFTYLLDNPENICCLCPNCHKKIHFSNTEVKKNLINTLLNTRQNLLKKFEISNIDDIINLYNYE